MQPSLQNITRALQKSWNADTAYNPGDWSIENKARGQCVVSSLIVQDYLGGDLIRYEISEQSVHETHYVNKLDDGTIIDTTNSQYITPVNMRLKPIELDRFNSIREKRLSDDSTAQRYLLLKQRVVEYLEAN
ncbi:MAG: hypothetical protein EOO17_04295 [Chloroflexi bacterium]|nr:MAG: hypothetical protein EOO17_04295 [Chloroflexota bacterium]